MKCNRREFLKGILTLGVYVAIPSEVKAVVESELLKTDDELQQVEQVNTVVIGLETFRIGDVYLSIEPPSEMSQVPLVIISTVLLEKNDSFRKASMNGGDVKVNIGGLLSLRGKILYVYLERHEQFMYPNIWMSVDEVEQLTEVRNA